MTDSDRGAYTPPTADAPLTFDARQPVRGTRPAPLTLIISGVVLLILVAAIIFFYRSGVRGDGEAPQTVGAPVGPLKTPAPEGEQPSDPAAGLQIYQEEAPAHPAAAPAAPAPTFTAPPEQPAARAAPPPPVKVAPAPAAAPAAAPAQASALKPAQSAAPPPAKPATTPAAPVSALPKPAAPAPKPAAAAPATPKPAAGASGAAGVQIGAFSSKALADSGWNDAARISPGKIAGKGKTVEPVQVNGSTLFRTTVTGFASKAEAKAFCDDLKAAGKNCFVK